jgi:hypothetical protein
MGSSYNLTEIDKLKNAKFDVWQLGILFYKIASFGESPYDDAKNENLKDSIISKNINYSKLDKYNPQIVQIIDKMLQISPANRYNISQLLNLIQFKDNKIPLLNIQMSRKEDIAISANMVNEEKKKIGNDFKYEKEINYVEEDINEYNDKNKIILNGVKIQGNLINDKNSMINQEIYPDGSVLPSFKNKFLNKLNNVDQNLVLDLAYKLTLLDKEYKKLDENKLAVYNITNYVNNNLKELYTIDSENINLLIKKFNDLLLSKKETIDLYEEMVKEKGEFAQDKFKALISNLIYEIKKLGIELEQEKSTSEKLRKKIKEQEIRNLDLKNEHQEKIEFYQKKIEILEEVIFSTENKSLNETDFKTKNKLIYNALANSIQNFTEVNTQLKASLEDNITKFKETKKNWLEDIIKAKEDFRNEMSFYLQKSVEQPTIYNFEKKENKDNTKDNKKNEEIEKLKKHIVELKETIKEQNNTIINNTNYIRDIDKQLKDKKEEIEELKEKLKEREVLNTPTPTPGK